MVSGLTGRTTSWPSLNAADDRRAALRLGAEDLVGRLLDQAELHQLGEALVDLGQLRPGGDRDHDLLRQPPAELLGDLVAERLGALGVVGPDVDVHERPAVLLAGDLRGEPVHVVVVAVHGDQRAAVHRGGDDLGPLEVGGDEDDRLHAGAGPGGGHRVGEVAGRGTGEDLAAELAGGRQRDRDDPVLEGVRRVAGVVLDPEVLDAELATEVVGLDQPGEAGLHVGARGDVGGHRQQLLVAPDVLGAGLDPGAGDRREVVADLQGAEALLAGVEGTEVLGGAALAAHEVDRVAEGAGTGGGAGTGNDRGAQRNPPSHLPR